MTSNPRKVLAAVDDLLFEPGGWFAIDRSNRRVPRVVIPTRQAGLSLVGRGQVATIVGRLRPEVVAVDIDMDDGRGARAADQITAWCARRGLWYLSRPSGQPGHRHVIVVPQDLGDDLETLVWQMRNQLAASSRQIDLRRTLRPLTAPHRLGGSPSQTCPPEMLRRLTAVLTADQAPINSRNTRLPAVVNVALVPRPRPKTPLPEPWEHYLRDGIRPALGGHDHSRSTYEAIATGALLRAGHTAVTAWRQILASHPDAMTKARASHHRWLLYVWNRAVLDDAAFTPALNRDPQVLAALAAARKRLWTLRPGERSRVSILRVGLAILDRMERADSLRVPVPERNLVLDTAITDRKTIRAALRHLHAHGFGTLHTDTLASGVGRAHSSFEFSVPAGEAPEIPPPGIHTPLPPALWSVLPPSAALFWHYLKTTTAGVDVARLLTGTGQTKPGTVPSRHQVATAVGVLRELGRIGLTTCDEHGIWHATSPEPEDARHHETVAEADQTHRVLRAKVHAERVAYRSRVFGEWGRQRAAAIDRQRRRHQAWWNDLGEQERKRRLAAVASASKFTQCQPDRVRHNSQWANRRRVVGLCEPEPHAVGFCSSWVGDRQRRSAHHARPRDRSP